jgi:hypothetical protein
MTSHRDLLVKLFPAATRLRYKPLFSQGPISVVQVVAQTCKEREEDIAVVVLGTRPSARTVTPTPLTMLL